MANRVLLWNSNFFNEVTWPIFLFSSLRLCWVLHKPLSVCLLSLDFSSIETINTVNESINTVCSTSLVATAMMHCSVNSSCSLAMDGWIGSLSADLSVTPGRPTPAATYTKQLIQSKEALCCPLQHRAWTLASESRLPRVTTSTLRLFCAAIPRCFLDNALLPPFPIYLLFPSLSLSAHSFPRLRWYWVGKLLNKNVPGSTDNWTASKTYV